MTSKNKLSYLQREKGKYAYSTGNRVFVWKNIIWPLILEVNRPWFTLETAILVILGIMAIYCIGKKFIPLTSSGSGGENA